MQIEISIGLLGLTNMDELNESFMARFSFWMGWYDHRLTFRNLKKVTNMNLVDDDTVKRLWIPPLTVSSATAGTRMMTYDDTASVMVDYDDDPDVAGLDILHETFKSSGSKIAIYYTNAFDMEQRCHFDLEDYPFDTQRCAINISFASFSMGMVLRFDTKQVIYSGPTTLNQFKIVEFKAGLCDWNTTVSAQIVLKRLINIHIMQTFFPTICLMSISIMTLYINPEHFKVTVMVSLTIMLVTYTLHQNVSNSLPKTGTVKLIDTWLMVGLILPFVVFMILVLNEIIGEQKVNDISAKRKSIGIKPRIFKWTRTLITIFTFLFIIGFLGSAFITYYNQ